MTAALELDLLTAETIGTVCEESGLRLLAQTETVVLAEREVVGMPFVFRRLACQRDPQTGAWRAGLFLRRGLAAHELVAKRGGFRDLLHFGLWLGGILSIQVGPVEVAAIRGRTT